MSLDKSIQHNKEKRKPYYDSRRFDGICRNNNYCPYCKRKRLYCSIKRELDAEEEIQEFEEFEEFEEEG